MEPEIRQHSIVLEINRGIAVKIPGKVAALEPVPPTGRTAKARLF